ncbi:MAG: peptidoglycan-binding domain-containing protein [Cypionkella sp.]|nr:peptidoglycan-binding domain-containing protein [Cypionkella sp.]
MSLRVGQNAPPDLDYIIAPQMAGMGAQTLQRGQSLQMSLPAPLGQQIGIAVVGLEPAGADMTACCMSVQRVHLPSACPIAPDQPAQPPAEPGLDLAISVSSDTTCRRSAATPNCKAVVEITQKQGDPLAAAPIFFTLTGREARALDDGGAAACTGIVGGQSICSLDVNRPLVLDVALDAGRPAGTAEICAALGVPQDDVARTLALQQALSRAGYAPGRADGKFGPATMAALTRFAADSGLPPITTEIPPEALFILGLSPTGDMNPANDSACTTVRVPAPPLLCDGKTARAKGGECACLYKGMSRVSATKCACRKGTVLGPNGCVKQTVRDDTPNKTDDDVRCDNPTVVKKDGSCTCRYKGTRMSKGGLCLCKSGLPPLPGVGCGVTFSIDILPSGPREKDGP